ncbi:hypothetical protein [Roseiconus lacunae]|uniref:hypothetical protein n=1 Tax=Roseiconus lacunae TaxID=2605694 RepID=UPI001E440123|nr:hypothetical protein [Roseiconus lacunae]
MSSHTLVSIELVEPTGLVIAMREKKPDGPRRRDDNFSSPLENSAEDSKPHLEPKRRRSDDRSTPPWARLTGAGLELAFFAIAIGGLGMLIDRALGNTRPLGLALGGLAGFALGMIRFISVATRASKSQREREHTSARQAQPKDTL